MKYVKTLGLAAIAATALMAFVGAGTASAAGVLCSAQESSCSAAKRWANGTVLTFSQAESILLKETGKPNGNGEPLDTCKKSSVSGSLTNGSSTTNANGSITTLEWGECTFTTTTTLNGGLEVESILEKGKSTHNGTVKSSAEIKVTISIPIFGSCVYGVPGGTSLGTITEGNPAKFDANAVATRRSGSSFTCPETANWTGAYTQTAPANTTLSVEPA